MPGEAGRLSVDSAGCLVVVEWRHIRPGNDLAGDQREERRKAASCWLAWRSSAAPLRAILVRDSCRGAPTRHIRIGLRSHRASGRLDTLSFPSVRGVGGGVAAFDIDRCKRLRG